MKEIEQKLYIIGTSISVLEERLNWTEKRVQKWSDKLKDAHDSGASIRRRSNLRIKLDESCEERNEARESLKIAKEWKKELKKELHESL